MNNKIDLEEIKKKLPENSSASDKYFSGEFKRNITEIPPEAYFNKRLFLYKLFSSWHDILEAGIKIPLLLVFSLAKLLVGGLLVVYLYRMFTSSSVININFIVPEEVNINLPYYWLFLILIFILFGIAGFRKLYKFFDKN